MDRSADEPTDEGGGSAKSDGLGRDGTIPAAPDGVAAGHTGEPSTFEPEEDEQASPHGREDQNREHHD